MGFFDTVREYFSILWSNVSDFPILNTGLYFKDLFWGFIGLNVLGFLLSRIFGFSPVGPSFRVGSRSSKEDISENRRSDER